MASIVDRGNRFPERFPRQSDPGYGIRQWNRSLRATEAAIKDPGHIVVFYESLVEGVEATLKTLCGIAGLEFEEAMLTPADRSSFTSPDEEWKHQVNAPVHAATSKFEKLFDEATRLWITRRLELGIFERIRRHASELSGGVLFSGEGREEDPHPG